MNKVSHTPQPLSLTSSLVKSAKRFFDRWTSPFVIGLVLLVWMGVSYYQLLPPIDLPGPSLVWKTMQGLWQHGYAGQSMMLNISISVFRIALGFGLSVIFGVLVGLLMGRSHIIFRAIDPILQFIRPVPPLAYIPLLVVWLGIGEAPKIVLILLGTLPIIVISTSAAVHKTPENRVRVAQCLGANNTQIFWRVIFPSALPDILTSMRVAVAAAWGSLVAAEMIAASAGMGWMIEVAGHEANVPVIFVGIVLIGLWGYTMELLIRALEGKLVPWRTHQ